MELLLDDIVHPLHSRSSGGIESGVGPGDEDREDAVPVQEDVVEVRELLALKYWRKLLASVRVGGELCGGCEL